MTVSQKAMLSRQSLSLSVALQLLALALVALLQLCRSHVCENVLLPLTVMLLEVLQFGLLLAALFFCMSHIKDKAMDFSELVTVYCTAVVSFAGMYWMIFHVGGKDVFVFDPRLQFLHHSPSFPSSSSPTPTRQGLNIPDFFVFLYFSVCTMTTLGIGDILPARWFAKLLVNVQMLTNTAVHVGLFAFAIHHFHTHLSDDDDAHRLPLHRRNCLQRLIKTARTHYPCIDRLRHHLVRYLLAYSLALQLLCLLWLLWSGRGTLERKEGRETSAVDQDIVICLVTQLVQFCFVFVMSLRLVRKASANADMSPVWILQSFLSTVLLFAGVYFSLYLRDAVHTLALSSSSSTSSPAEAALHRVLLNCMYFSVTVMTFTGFGDILPLNHAARATVCCQLLVGVCYQVIIFGVGTSRFISYLGLNLRTPTLTPRRTRTPTQPATTA